MAVAEIEIETDKLHAWCSQWLGSVPESTLFSAGNLSHVIGLRLADGRDVVVKIRPRDERQAGTAFVHQHLWQAGFPCPQPLVGPVPFGQ